MNEGGGVGMYSLDTDQLTGQWASIGVTDLEMEDLVRESGKGKPVK